MAVVTTATGATRATPTGPPPGHAHRDHPAHGLQIVDLRDRPAHGLQIVDLLDHCLDRSVAFCQALGHRHSKRVLLCLPLGLGRLRSGFVAAAFSF